MLDSFEDTYAEYKKLFSKIDQADSIGGKNELFRQLAALLSKMEQGIYGESSSATDSQESVHCEAYLSDAAGWM